MSLTVDGVWKSGVWATTVWADGVWFEGSTTVVEDHDGFDAKRHKRKKREQHERRETIELAFRAALETAPEKAEEIIHEYSPEGAKAQIPSIEAKWFDWQALEKNKGHIQWLMSQLQKKQEAEDQEFIEVMSLLRL